MRAVHAAIASVIAVIAGCAAESPPVPAPQGESPSPAPATEPAQPAAPETITARYDCPGAAAVEIIRDGRFARLRMTDGRVVNLGVIRGSSPPVWSEVGLRFIADESGAELSQDNGRTVRCSVAEPTSPATR